MMRALSASQLLDVWEQGRTQRASQRGLALLNAASPQTPPVSWAQRSVGQRDAALLTLRESTFGPQLSGLAECHACGELLELAFQVADIRVSTKSEATDELSLNVSDHELRFRLPTSQDLSVIEQSGDDDAWLPLLRRCLLSARQDDQPIAIDQLPGEVVAAVVERMAEADPQADVQLALKCPACAHQWKAPFDIVTFFWSEIEAWVQRTLREVHCLASAYGWHEADILAMSAWRRQFYLRTVSA